MNEEDAYAMRIKLVRPRRNTVTVWQAPADIRFVSRRQLLLIRWGEEVESRRTWFWGWVVARVELRLFGDGEPIPPSVYTDPAGS